MAHDREKEKLMKRANRQLVKVGQKLIASRGRDAVAENGAIARIDIASGTVLVKNVNLADIFREPEMQMATPMAQATAA